MNSSESNTYILHRENISGGTEVKFEKVILVPVGVKTFYILRWQKKC